MPKRTNVRTIHVHRHTCDGTVRRVVRRDKLGDSYVSLYHPRAALRTHNVVWARVGPGPAAWHYFYEKIWKRLPDDIKACRVHR